MSETEISPPSPPKTAEAGADPTAHSEPAKMSRRGFLKRAAALSAALAVPTVVTGRLGVNAAMDRINTVAESGPIEQTRLHEAGLGEYSTALKEQQKYKAIFGDVFMDWNKTATFPAMRNLMLSLDAASSGRPLPEEAAIFQTGWGTNKENAAQDARLKLNEIKINTEFPQDEVPMRNALRALPSMMPAVVCAYGDTIDATKGGGYYSDEGIGLAIDPQNHADSLFIAIHEGQHGIFLKALPEIRKYLDKSDYAQFAATYIKAAGETLTEWTDQPLSIRNDIEPLIDDLPAKAEEIVTHIQAVESLILKYSLSTPGDGENMAIAGFDDPRKRNLWSYNALVHRVSEAWKAAPADSEIRNDPTAIDVMSHLVTATAHRFVFDNAKLNGPQDIPVNRRHGEVWGSFLNAFSSYRGEPTMQGFFESLDRADVASMKSLCEGYGWETVHFDNDPKGETYAPHVLFKLPLQEEGKDAYALFFSNYGARDGSITRYLTFTSPPEDGQPRNLEFKRKKRMTKLEGGQPVEAVMTVFQFSTDREQDVLLNVDVVSPTEADMPPQDKAVIARHAVMGSSDAPRPVAVEIDSSSPISIPRRTKSGESVDPDQIRFVSTTARSDDDIAIFLTKQLTGEPQGSVGLFANRTTGTFLSLKTTEGPMSVYQLPQLLQSPTITSEGLREVAPGVFVPHEQYGSEWGFTAPREGIDLGSSDVRYQVKPVKNGPGSYEFQVFKSSNSTGKLVVEKVEGAEVFLLKT